MSWKVWNVRGSTAAAGGEGFQQWIFNFQPNTAIKLHAVKVGGYLQATGTVITKTIPCKLQIQSATLIAREPENAQYNGPSAPVNDNTQMEFLTDISEGEVPLDTQIESGTLCQFVVRTFPPAALALNDVTGFYFQLWYDILEGGIIS